MTTDGAFWLTVGIILVLILVSAFLSGSETAIAAASRSRLRARADRGDRGAARALRLSEDGERVVGAMLLGSSAVNILSASLATALLTRTLGDPGVAIAAAAIAGLVLIFAEVLPRTYAITCPESVATRVARPASWCLRVLSPAAGAVRSIAAGILLLFGVRPDPGRHMYSIRDEIAGALAIGHSDGAFEKEDRDRLLGALDLSDRTVEEIMRHRSQIEMIDADSDPKALIQAVLSSAHTRLPIFRGTRENILGVVHAKELLRAVDRFLREGDGQLDSVSDLDVMSVAAKPYFVPDTTTLDEQMREFLKRRSHFALVVDEYGDLRGLITLEDILEEIVGEITDEFDIDREHPLKRLDTGDCVVDGAMTIRDFNRATDWSLPDDEANTVAGLVIHEAQTIPTEGQAFNFHGYRFEILSRKENRLTRLKIRPV